MTDNELEIAARKYCEILGLDPDAQVSHGADPDANGFVFDILLHSPQWTRIARRIPQHQAMNEAIEFAKRHLVQEGAAPKRPHEVGG